MLSLNLSDDKYLSNVRSAECLQLDLNSKISKKKQIKLLNAKLKQLKQKCKILRQQSKTQRQMLSNLMSQTSTLQQKTNSGIQACKQVCTQMLDNHNKFNVHHNQPIIISTINTVIQNNNSVAELILQSKCSLSMLNFQNQKRIQYPVQNLENNARNVQTSHQIIQNLVIQNQKVKKNVYDAPTSRSFTSSLKQQQSKRSNKLVAKQAKIYSTSTLPSQEDLSCYEKDQNRQCLANKKQRSQKPSTIHKDSQISSHKNLLKQTQIKLKQNQKIHNRIKISSRNQNIFINYFYAITVVIILTIIVKITLL